MKLPPSPGTEAADIMPLVAVLSESGSAFSVPRQQVNSPADAAANSSSKQIKNIVL